MLREGSAHRSVWLAWETGVLDVLLPEVAAYLSDSQEHDGAAWRVLTALDGLTSQRGPLDDVVLCSALLLGPLREACSDVEDRVEAAREFLEPVAERLAMPRRIADSIRRIAALLPKLAAGRSGRFARTSIYPLATQVLGLCEGVRNQAPATSRPDSSHAPAHRRRTRRRQKPTAKSPKP